MKRFKFVLLAALVAVPLLYSCDSKSDGPDQVALVTVKQSFDAAGFYGVLDNGDRLYPSVMRVQYKPTNEIQRALIYFKEIHTPIQGFEYNADVYAVNEVTTKPIDIVTTPAADTLTDPIEITNAFIGGGFLNVEFKVNIDMYNPKQTLTVALQSKQIDGPAENYGSYFPLELGFKCTPAIEEHTGYTITSMACFRLGEFSLEQLGCEGYEISYKKLNGNNDVEKYIVTPSQQQIQ